MRAAEFESLAQQVGKDLIVTDGTTLLGADDKGGRGGDHGHGALFRRKPRRAARQESASPLPPMKKSAAA